MSTPPQTAVDEGSYLSPTTPERKHAFDGSTLNSRSGSIQSSDEATRCRSNSGISATSSVTVHSKSSLDFDPPEEALKPDHGNEKDFQVENNPFAFSPGQLNKLLNPKSLSAYKALGGLRGLERGLRTSITAGLSIDETRLDGQVSFEEATAAASGKDFSDVALSRHTSAAAPVASDAKEHLVDRLRVFGDNRLPERKPAGILMLIWRAYNDKILILLTVAAVISLALGIYETVSGESGVDWVEGVAICVAILIVVTVGAANDWQKERQFVKLNKRVSPGVFSCIVSFSSLTALLRKMTAKSRSSDPANPSKSRSTTSRPVTCFTLNPAMLFLLMEFSSPDTGSNATSLPPPVNPTR